jgi:probable aminopeptidase NPEPL1
MLNLHFDDKVPTLGAGTSILCGRRAALERLLSSLPEGLAPVFPAMLASLAPKDAGEATLTWLAGKEAGAPPSKVVLICLPEPASRHNSPGRPDAIAALLGKHLPAREDATVVVCLDQAAHAFAAGCAVARACPGFSQRGGGDPAPDTTLRVHLLGPGLAADAQAVAAELPRIREAASGLRQAARLVDMPANELTTLAVCAEAERVAQEIGAELTIIQGEALREKGLGGLYSVGRAAATPPALVHLAYGPSSAAEQIVWVGKGIVYDTGGLALKGKTDMPGMKADMGGAAAVLAAFAARVRTGGLRGRLHALLCLAENAIGPLATRPDDIIRLYSGKSIEVNNPDAEGRLVVGDGVAYAARHLSPSVIVDLATLTGAQLIATGKRHAAVVSNDEAWEAAVVTAGRSSGDLVHPLPYCPEFFRGEFKSEVADLKNSVKDRNNAQSSCAAQFIAEQLGGYTGPWVHIDLAGPVVRDERATGFGVPLLLELFRP